MTRALPRTSFSSCRLVRSLSRLSVVDVADSNQPLAERLGQWLAVTDAITLFAALNPSPARTTTALSGTPSPGGVTLPEELSRIRMALANSITGDDGGKTRIRLPQPTPGTPVEILADFTPYRRYYLAQQRNLAASIGPLRIMAREALAACSSGLGQLAELDAALDQALSNREGDLLATVPTLLERRFAELRQTHQAALVDSGKADEPEQWFLPGGWLARFCGELQDVLLAELDVRLQPVTGLIEAYGNELATR
jgi:hypothetical protein